ncbi:MAG TPA: GNAT family N-acetyltransferase [Candidatus Limnocylindrales bacterium]|nr:GNAT family N-acetyltransferase [Candidatus Limnocylindrales bacterium]
MAATDRPAGPVIAPPLEDVSPEGFRAAIEADSIATRVIAGERPHTSHLDPDAAWAVGDPMDLFANTVASANFDPAHADARIAEIVATYDALPSPFVWWRSPFHGPADLGERLERAHVSPVGTGPAMAMDLANLAAPREAADLEIRGVVDEAGYRDYMAVLSAEPVAPGAPPMYTPETIERRIAHVVPELARQPAPMRLVGYVGGQPVATVRLSLAGGSAGIYAVATLVEHRGHGYGGAMTHTALATGRDLGYRIATLQSTELGHRVYLRLGFADIFEYTIHVHLPGGGRLDA